MQVRDRPHAQDRVWMSRLITLHIHRKDTKRFIPHIMKISDESSGLPTLARRWFGREGKETILVFEGRARVRGPARGVNFSLATRRERQGLLISLPRYRAEKGGGWVKLKAISSQISETGVGPYYHMGHLWMMSDAIPFLFEPFLDLTDTVLCSVVQESRSALFFICGLCRGAALTLYVSI